MFYKIRKVYSPEIFQGHGKKHSQFEGWYYKLVDDLRKNACAIIPGVLLSKNKQKSQCFIQILSGKTGKSVYHQYPINEFQASKKKLELRIGPNLFRKDYLELNIKSMKQNIEGQIRMSNLNPWPVTLTSPGIMGWYAFMPFMECYHGVVSLDHQLNGSLTIDGHQIDFGGGSGYTEKDWGKSFPSSYIWMQSNHFKQSGICLTVSIANIPWLKGSFRGFIVGFLYQGKLYRFTTYTKATIHEIQIDDSTVKLSIFNLTHILKIRAERSGGGFLHAPYEMQMHKRVSHSLTGKIHIEFFEKVEHKQKLIFKGTGYCAGIEMNGNLDSILKR